jgi:RHH-type rel operon transcriptional repressor/antitoxin RelB
MPLSIRLPENIEARLNSLAALTGRSKTYYVTEAICEHLEDLEDLYLAEREYAAIKAGKSKTIPVEEVMKSYGMEVVD